MRIAGLALVWTLLLYSCKEVSFPVPQPADLPGLKEVPVRLRGEYVGIDEKGNDTDTLIIESWGYHFRDTQDNDWLGRGTLSDSLVIKQFENYYFVNFRSGDQWVLRVIRQKPSGSIDFLSIQIGDDSKRKDILKKLAKRFAIKEIERKDEIYYQINPTRQQLLQLIKEGYFTGDELQKIK